MIDRREIDRRIAARRRQQIDAGFLQMEIDRRAADRRVRMRRLADNAKAHRVSELVYDAFLRGHGHPPQLSTLEGKTR